VSELERWETEPPTKQTRKQLAQIEQQAMVRRASTRAARQEAADNLEAAESLHLLKAQCRVAGTYALADYATHRATTLNKSITHQSRDNPALELMHRGFEETAATVSALIIYNYGTAR
jgi:hypothetical protein